MEATFSKGGVDAAKFTEPGRKIHCVVLKFLILIQTATGIQYTFTAAVSQRNLIQALG
jgi:hypothetical protein